ncbi:hypothetical protein AA313_de0203858 [Arthrobotrys entomopaga]|nr:hypothetical protein AA313_de0203858 [Arthrobotrys entomopaga]
MSNSHGGWRKIRFSVEYISGRGLAIAGEYSSGYLLRFYRGESEKNVFGYSNQISECFIQRDSSVPPELKSRALWHLPVDHDSSVTTELSIQLYT